MAIVGRQVERQVSFSGESNRGLKRALVTGGAGFIGSNLIRSLLGEGMEVDCVDNLSTGLAQNINDLESLQAFRFLEHDISTDDFSDAVADRHYDEIYHLACPTGVPNIRLMGQEMLDVCSAGTANVVNIAKSRNARLIFTSSCEVYGDPEVFPQNETYSGNVDPRGPRGPYEEGKRFSEAYIMMAVRHFDLDAKIVRIFNTYGVGMSFNDQRIIPRFLSNGLRGDPMTVYGDGSQSRTYLYVDDNVAGLKLVLRKGETGQAYNLGGTDKITVHELAQIVNSHLPSAVEIQNKPHFIKDHHGRLPDTAAIRALGWHPTITLDDGLRRMLDSVHLTFKWKSNCRPIPVTTPTATVTDSAMIT